MQTVAFVATGLWAWVRVPVDTYGRSSPVQKNIRSVDQTGRASVEAAVAAAADKAVAAAADRAVATAADKAVTGGRGVSWPYVPTRKPAWAKNPLLLPHPLTALLLQTVAAPLLVQIPKLLVNLAPTLSATHEAVPQRFAAQLETQAPWATAAQVAAQPVGIGLEMAVVLELVLQVLVLEDLELDQNQLVAEGK
ncbi:hypothetical protein Taro_048607 [Colocasia esculenta]|uniref:Uncharacterized protein n=1 Tax=Colocasia esculenta TaxID=4460 RepID=A0A843X8M3_COLES|nr:hypothetical protein [Colocasia esculenta]